MSDEQDDHYGPETTKDGVHACDSSECMTNGVSDGDLHHIGFSLNAIAPHIADSPIKTTVFKTGDGLYVLLTVDYVDGTTEHRAVIGAVYTPTMMADLRAKGYTLTLQEAEGGVN